MGIPQKLPLSPLLFTWVLSISCLGASGRGNNVKFLKAPLVFSSSDSAVFKFEILDGRSGGSCRDCIVKCKLDGHSSTACGAREVSYTGLLDGYHTFEVCINGPGGDRCTSFSWTVDTIPPTAYISAASPFTNSSNVSVNILFSEPCTGEGGFRCSMNDCNLLVYGAGAVVPSTLMALQPDLIYSLVVAISSDVQYGRLVLVMDRNFCTDASGNRFTRTTNSSFFLHFDRRNVSVSVRTRIPEKLLLINNIMRAVEATNSNKNLSIYLHFSVPVLNSSAEILSILQTSAGALLPTNRSTLGNRRFGFLVRNISTIAVVTISLETSFIISRQGTLVSPNEPSTFLYDAERPSVMLSTSTLRTREHGVLVVIKFVKPVFDFNSSAVLISGGYLRRFHEISWCIYTMHIQIVDYVVSLKVPENATRDVAGNQNLASNLLQVRHYSIPTISSVLSAFTTAVFVVTTLTSAVLTVSTASLLSFGALSGSSYFVSEPSRNLMRIAYHIQVFTQSKWLAAVVPVEYFEFARGIQWSIPYLSLPWEVKSSGSYLGESSFYGGTFSETSEASKLQSYEFAPRNGGFRMNAPQYGSPLSSMEYRAYFENQNMKPEAEFIRQITQNSDRWKDFGRSMFWLAVIGGTLSVLRMLILVILRLRRKNLNKDKSYGALTFPRFEIFLALLALPCVCQASAAIIRGRSTGGVIVGSLLLGFSSILLISILLFISFGITMGKLLQYKEVHREGQELHWYQGIVRASLGPSKRGQWNWKNRPDSIHLTKLGPLFEDLRGPPKYMVSQISSTGTSGKQSNKIIASDDETEDAEVPFIQKLFGILRIYYTVLELVKRAALGFVAGAYSNSSSKVPTLVVLSITSFQLFFLVLKKPFIKKKVQFVEIISVAGEVGIFGACFIILEKDLSEAGEQRLGFFMLALFMVGFLAQIVNEWYALYRQVLKLSPDENSLFLGLKTALVGILLIFLPSRMVSKFEDRVSSDQTEGETASRVSTGSQGGANSGGNERSWVRQLREIAKDSFSREDKRVPKDPSSSRRTRSSSMSSSADFKEKSKTLHKDLEAIFSFPSSSK